MSLEELRKELDEVDKILEEQFIKRMEIVADVADFKKANGLPTLDSGREQVVLDKHGTSAGPLYEPYVRDYFTQLMRISKDYQNARRNEQDV